MQLEAHSVGFVEIDVEQDPAIAQKLVDDGWRRMPVVVTPDGSWSGMDMNQLRNLWS